jgi:uncharacterized repeat protein (TIGR03803 family)
VLYTFTGLNGDGAVPGGGLVIDSSGNLFGTTSEGGGSLNCGTYNGLPGCGTVFELVKSSSGYTETTLHSFTSSNGDGADPMGSLITDSSGNLYGTTAVGGNPGCAFSNGCGTVFELVNSPSGYTYTVLYKFTGSNGDGSISSGGLIMDSAGNLYGTTSEGGGSPNCVPEGCGTVFELVKSSGYTETILHSFTYSDGIEPNGLTMDSSGNLYGTTMQGPGTANCTLTTTTLGCGTVFELVNSSSGYTLTTLHNFSNSDGDGWWPTGGLIVDSAGNLYGTTTLGGVANNGTVFELVNSSSGYTEAVLHSFTDSTGEGRVPNAGLMMDSSGYLYGTNNRGGGSANCGTTIGCGTIFLFPIHAQTTTTLTSSKNPASADDSVTFTAKVAAWYVAPTGSVTFSNGTMPLGTQTLTSGQAAVTIASADSLGIGAFTITAQYTPDTSAFASSSATLLQTVNLPGVALTGSSNTFSGNQTVNGVLTATSFVGDGSGLTGIVASSANTANTANYALTAGIANTAGALATTPGQCGTNMFSTGIAANGNANCLQPVSANLSDAANLVFNMQANTFTGGKQTLPASTANYASFNIPNTGAVPSTPAMGDLWLTTADSHLFFLDKTSTPQRLAFLSDVNSLDTGLLGGTNTFTGSNTFSLPINGSITGNAATATNATYAASAGTAVTAGSATQANNALDLGGVAASDYARLDIGNTFTGNQTVTGNETVTGNVSVSGNASTTGTVTIGSGGTPIKEHLSMTFNPKFPALLPLSCSSANFTFTGASDGDTLALGVPAERMNGGGVVFYIAWVSAANTVTIQVCNAFAAPQKTAGTGNIRVDIWKH